MPQASGQELQLAEAWRKLTWLPRCHQQPQTWPSCPCRASACEPHRGGDPHASSVLSDAGINVDMISTSEVRVNVVNAGKDGQLALAALQQTFADALR